MTRLDEHFRILTQHAKKYSRDSARGLKLSIDLWIITFVRYLLGISYLLIIDICWKNSVEKIKMGVRSTVLDFNHISAALLRVLAY